MSTHPVIWAGLVMIAAQLAFRGWILFTGWFQFDDFAFIAKALNSGLTWDYATQPYAGHLMPGGFVLMWLLSQDSPLSFTEPALVLLVMQAIASIGCLRVLHLMFGSRAGILPPLAIYLFSVISLPAFVWWAAGINQIPFQIALFYGLASHLTYMRTQRFRHAIATMLWIAGGLLFYEKVLLLIPVFALFSFCYYTSGTAPERVAGLWARYRAGIALYGVVALGYVTLYTLHALNFDVDNANEYPLGPVASRLVFKAFATGIIGGPWEWTPYEPAGATADPPQLLILMSWVLIAGIVVEAARTRKRSKRAWSLAGTLIAADVLLITAGRVFLVGPLIALEYRYQTELSAIVAISLALAFLPLDGAVESAERVATATFADTRRWVATATVAVVASSLVSSYQFAGHWWKDRSRQYFANVDKTLPAEPERERLVDTAIPDYLIWGFNYPENLASFALAMFDDRTEYVRQATDHLSIIDRDGRVRQVFLEPARVGEPGTEKGCGHRITGAGTTVPLDGPVFGGGWWLRLGYIASGDSPMEITFGDRTVRTEVEAGLHALFVQADGAYDEIRVSGLSQGVAVCTDDVVIGTPRAGPRL
jgi:hypothetical protein